MAWAIPLVKFLRLGRARSSQYQEITGRNAAAYFLRLDCGCSDLDSFVNSDYEALADDRKKVYCRS